MLRIGERRAGWALRLALCAGFGLVPALPAGAVDLIGRAARFAWTPTSGPVAGYAVYVSRNGEPFPPNASKFALRDNPKVTVIGAYGEWVNIRVAAFDALGNVGPLSPSSEAIRFVNPFSGETPGQTPPPPPPSPSTDEEAGSINLAAHACTEVPVLTGVESLRIDSLHKEETDLILSLAYCDGYWATTDGQGLTLSGTYEPVEDRPNKLVLHLDEISERELLATLGARATLRLGFHVVTDLNKSARFRLKRKGETGVIRLRGRLNLLEVGYGDLGAYKVKVSASTAGS